MKYPVLALLLVLAAPTAIAQEPTPQDDVPTPPPTLDLNSLFQSEASWRPVLTTRFSYEAEQDDFEYWESFLAARFTLPNVANSLSNTLTLTAERADIDTPAFVDIPGELYVLGVNYAWTRRLNKEWTLRINLNPRFASDFDNTSTDAWHVRAAAMAVYRPNPRWLVGFGLFLTGNDDVPIIAGPGAVWKPKRWLELNLFFPQPRISFLVTQNRQREGWFYVSGQWDNETWAYERANGGDDEVTYHNLKAAIGWEHGPRGGLLGRAKKGLRWNVEAGYVFDRELDFDDHIPDFKPDNTVYLEAGLSF